MATTSIPQWTLAGTLVQACNCEWGCPCEFNAPPSQGYCEGTWTWHISGGSFGEVDMRGVRFAAAARWPGAIHEGNGEVLPIIDDRATPDQREAIGTLLSGQAGGPWGILVATFTSVHEPAFVRWDVELAESETRIEAGDILTMKLTPIRNPVTGAVNEPTVVLPTGFTSKALHHTSTTEFSVDDGIAYAYPGKDAAWGEFEYSGPSS